MAPDETGFHYLNNELPTIFAALRQWSHLCANHRIGNMENLKIWLKKYGVNTVLVVSVILLWISPDAKAWVMRRILSTGILNFRFQSGWIDSRPADETIQKALAFSAKNLSGKTINLNDLRGKVVFINFWASWCPPCRAELPSIQEFYNDYKDNPGVVFVLVNMDDNPEKKEWPFWIQTAIQYRFW